MAFQINSTKTPKTSNSPNIISADISNKESSSDPKNLNSRLVSENPTINGLINDINTKKEIDQK